MLTFTVNIVCIVLFGINALMHFKMNNKQNAIIWLIGAIIWCVVAYQNYNAMMTTP